MKKIRLLLCTIFGLTILVSGLSLLLPSPSDASVREYYSPIATSAVLIDVMLALGSAVLFLMALRRFRPELKPAYRLLAFSTVAVGLGLLIFPYIEYYGLWDNLWLNMSSYLQYLVGAPLMYLGVRMFYKKLQLKGAAASFIVVIAAIAICSAIHPFLPYDNAWPFTIWQYNLFKIVTIIPFVLYIAAGLMALRILQRTGREYHSAFTWLVIAMAFYAINTLGIILIEVIGYEHAYYANRIYTAPAVLGDLALVFAGYSFVCIGIARRAQSKQGNVTSVDIILHTASLASNQALIDEQLDKLRIITARKSSDALTDEDQATLKSAYLAIEEFLVNEDPLRTYTRESVRLNVALRLGLDQNSGHTFWPAVSS